MEQLTEKIVRLAWEEELSISCVYLRGPQTRNHCKDLLEIRNPENSVDKLIGYISLSSPLGINYRESVYVRKPTEEEMRKIVKIGNELNIPVFKD